MFYEVLKSCNTTVTDAVGDWL